MDSDKTVVLGSDHAAYPLKETIKSFLSENGYTVIDLGTDGPTSVNYTDFGIRMASGISDGTYSRGILLCGTGLGMSMVANRFKNVRAALCNDIFSARMSREHNNANILVLGGRVIGDILAIELVKTYLETPFEGGRHQNRLDMFDNYGQAPIDC